MEKPDWLKQENIVITPFPPMPMIEKVEATGFASFTEQEGGIFRTYFKK